MHRLSFKVVSATLSVSAGIVYLLCVIFRPVFPNWAMYTTPMWLAAFPGFSWTLVGILLGLVESLLYGLLAAVIFVPVYNFFVTRFAQTARETSARNNR